MLFIKYLPIYLFLLLFSCKNDSKKEDKNTSNRFEAKAEFDEQKGVYIAFSNVEHINGLSNHPVTANIIANLLPFIKVNFIVPSDSALNVFKPFLHDSLWKHPNLNIIKQPYQEFWLRDMGPVFLKNAKNERVMLDYSFNAWGYSDSMTVQLDENLDENLANYLKIPILSTPLIHEGGDSEFNGKGTMIVVEAVEKQRNPSLSLQQMEQIFKDKFGQKKIIWLKKGVHEDDFSFDGPIPIGRNELGYTLLTTGGHIDEFCRFVNPNTLLLAQVDSADFDDPIAKENYIRMEENYQILKNATDQDGKPFTIIRMPMPRTIIRKLNTKDYVYQQLSAMNFEKTGMKFPIGKAVNGIMASSYLNFLITNKVVLAQKYYKEGMDLTFKKRDEASLKILKSVFPDRTIIQLDATPVNWGGGGIHCITANEF